MPWFVCAASAAPQPKTVLEGVYTSAQAKRGQIAYDAKCASCHRADLGGFSGPPLKGDLFLDRWREFKLSVLFDLMKSAMPTDNPGTLSLAAYLDIQAYILQMNEIPAGTKELTTQVPGAVLFVSKNGPKPLPSGAQVEVVACLTEDSGNGWFLTKAREPVRTLNPWELTAEEMNEARRLPLGDQLFRLQNLSDVPGFRPEMAGQKVDAKGILVRQPKNERVNLNSLRTLAATCE